LVDIDGTVIEVRSKCGNTNWQDEYMTFKVWGFKVGPLKDYNKIGFI